MQTFALRLLPEMDLRLVLIDFAQARPLEAGFILTGVGSLRQAVLRFAGAQQSVVLPGPWEVVSLVGTLCPTGVHLHTCLANGTGQTVGGHVLTGCIVYTTCELVLGDCPTYRFERKLAKETGFYELSIDRREE